MFDAAGPVLGIDPGVSRCGYGAVARGEGGTLVAEAFGVIHTEPEAALPERLAVLQRELDGLVHELSPCALAVERVLFQVNTRTAMSVGQASGLALAVAACRYSTTARTR
jgi:crossover junction endodeoxyribonuclease RuvC